MIGRVVILAICASLFSVPAHAAPTTRCSIGNKAKVQWKSWRYQATVKSVRGGKYCIHYDGWNKSYDECVDASRIQCTGSRLPFSPGDAGIEVLWKSIYYKATIKSVKGKRYCVSYEGYESSWDECVKPERVRQK